MNLQMLKPAPDYFFRSEDVMGRTLTITELNESMCSECFHKTYTTFCKKCKRHICDACSDWTFKKLGRGKKMIRVIDVKCPCRKLLYNDFY